VAELALMAEQTQRAPGDADAAALAYLAGLLRSRVNRCGEGDAGDAEHRSRARAALGVFNAELVAAGIPVPV
jgi:hypothetical protein